MKLRALGNTGVQVSEISLGCGSFGGGWGSMDVDAIPKMVTAALDRGVNLFDTANSYGDGLGESRLGDALDSQPGRQALVVTKCGNPLTVHGEYPDFGNVAQIRGLCEASLQRLKREVIDVLLCHRSVLTPAEIEPCQQTFAQLKDEGLLRFYGISSHDFTTIRQFFRDGTGGICEVDYSILNRTAESEILPFCRERGTGVIVRSPLYRGLLTGKHGCHARFEDTIRQSWNDAARAHFQQKASQAEAVIDLLGAIDPVQFALKFILQRNEVGCVIPGAKSVQDVVHNSSELKDCPAVFHALEEVRRLSNGWEF